MFVMFLILTIIVSQTNASTHYSRQKLLQIGQSYTDDYYNLETLPQEIRRSPGLSLIPIYNGRRRRRRKERKQKRGKRAGLLTRLKAAPHKIPLPSVFLANTRSLTNKMDELRLEIATHKTTKDCCLLIFSETWLNPSIPDVAVDLVGRTLHRADRTTESGKKTGGGLCVFVNDSRCINSTMIDKFCSLDLEYLMLRCRPFYLPREYTVVIVMAVYIPPQANVKMALEQLYDVISGQQNKHPDGVFIIAGDFNQASLKTVFPRFYQHVKCKTRRKYVGPCLYKHKRHL